MIQSLRNVRISNILNAERRDHRPAAASLSCAHTSLAPQCLVKEGNTVVPAPRVNSLNHPAHHQHLSILHRLPATLDHTSGIPSGPKLAICRITYSGKKKNRDGVEVVDLTDSDLERPYSGTPEDSSPDQLTRTISLAPRSTENLFKCKQPTCTFGDKVSSISA